VIATSDKDFLLAAGIEPYEPEAFICHERYEEVRDNVIKTIAILQFLAIVSSLIWMSMK
jgi:hypothetical protein